MSGHTHTLAEWAAMVGMSASGYAAFSVFWLLFVGAERSDFDPRPRFGRLVESGRIDFLLVVVGPFLAAVRDGVRDVAALLVLLTTSPKGAMAA